MNKKNVNSNGFDYVDLDLPSGTLWATCNVGANKSTDYGLYFQWGDTVGYKEDQIGKDKQFNWDDYEMNPSGDGETFIKYRNASLVLDILELDDDAASVNMGGSWHIPTPAQIQELLDNTISEWAILDGVNGRLFKSKKDDSKSIFIPAAGCASSGSLGSSGSSGVVWSSTLYTGYVYCGRYLSFVSGNVSLYYSSRYYGFSVRGVIG